MCMDHRMICKCGRNSASFNFKDDIMPSEVVGALFCPNCSTDIAFDPDSMIKDNGWVIKYDMDLAKFMGHKLKAESITPDYLFDEGFCTWRGVYPNDHIDSLKEREELVAMAKINPKKYLDEFKGWGIRRMQRLTDEGWRKARTA